MFDITPVDYMTTFFYANICIRYFYSIHMPSIKKIYKNAIGFFRAFMYYATYEYGNTRNRCRSSQ